MNLKVLHLTHTDINKDPRIIKSIKAIDKLSWIEVYGIGIQDSSHYSRRFETKDSIDINSITLKLFSKKLTFLPNILRHLFTLLEFLLRSFFIINKFKPSVIHCHDTLALPIAILFKVFHSKLKLIYDAHELGSNRNGIDNFFSKIVYFFEKITWRFIDHFISVSPSIIKWYEEEYGRKKNTLILNSPEIETKKTKNSNGFRKKFLINDDEKLFIYVGEINKGRGITNLLEIFKDLKSRILFLGYGPLVNKVKDFEKNYSNIHYHEAVEPDSLISLIQEADVGLCLVERVSLSDYFCLPNKLFEYAFAGLPVIASDFPDIKFLVEKYDLGFCCDSGSIKDVKKNIERYESIIKISKNDVSKLHDLSWQKQELNLINVYRRLREDFDISS
jgi:glycosyltransferase involved in cell wall biosynthesis|tara:strand:+ start:8325 stop:9491 length:1167 start_codon:yes stop_codon:yes gene_type:complete